MTQFQKRIKKRLTETVTYWPPGDTDDYSKTIPSDPIEIKVRWEDTVIDFIDREGNVLSSKARIFSLTPVAFNGILWRGKNADPDPLKNPGALEIRQIGSSKDLGGNFDLYVIMV